MGRRQDEFAEFFTARFDFARRIGYALCGDWTEAEELAQTAFVRMYAHWGRVRTETADAYLRTVLTRAFLDTRRRGRAREQVMAEVPERAAPEAGYDHERETLIAALASVPARQRAVLVLRFLQDLSIEQAASTLGCSTGTVKSQTTRGLANLRQAYQALSGELTGPQGLTGLGYA